MNDIVIFHTPYFIGYFHQANYLRNVIIKDYIRYYTTHNSGAFSKIHILHIKVYYLYAVYMSLELLFFMVYITAKAQ